MFDSDSMQGKNMGYVQERNKSAVLCALWSHANATRKELATITGLTPAAMTNIVRDLLREGWLREVGEAKGPRGRSGIALEINSNFRNVIGIRLARNYVACGLFNLSGQLAFSNEVAIPDRQQPDEVIRIILKLIDEAFVRVQDRRLVAAIGIAVPGPLNAFERKINLITNFPGWRDIRIGAIIEDALSLPVIVAHDASAAALAEKWFGAAKEARCLLWVAAGRGVGAGLLLDGQVYHGVTGSAGEIGHMTIDCNGPTCECGNRGCLEMYCSSTALLSRARRIAQEGQCWVPGDPEGGCNLDDLRKLAQAGDATAIRLIRESANYLAFGLASLVNMLNPDMIVLGDEMCRLGDVWVEAVMQCLALRILPDFLSHLYVVRSAISGDPFLIGSGVLAIEYLFRNPMIISKSPVSVRQAGRWEGGQHSMSIGTRPSWDSRSVGGPSR